MKLPGSSDRRSRPDPNEARSSRIRWVIRLAVVGLVVAYFVFRDDLPSFDPKYVIEEIASRIGAWSYLLVGGLAFLETGAFVGLIAPGEFTVILGGAVAGQGEASVWLMIAITWFAAFAGDSVSFYLGARLGRDFLVRNGPKFRITEERLTQVEDYFSKHGGKTILIGRFIGLVRALAPFIAGTSKMPYGAFAPYSILGTGIWATILVLIGYFASQSLDTAASIVGRTLIGFGILVGIAVGVTLAFRWLSKPENRSKAVREMESRPVLRPVVTLARRFKPQLLFIRDRLTPGDGVGLELTTLLATVSVALFVLVAYWTIVAADPGPTPGDTTAYDISTGIETSWLTAIAEALTVLGSLEVTLAIALLAGVGLFVMGRRIELAVLVIGIAVSFLLVPEIKDWVQRPRPPDPLIDAKGWSFPSGHATHSVIYTWLAVTIAFRLVPKYSHRTVVIVAGLVLTALVGLTRVYLRVHWMSDVSSGWALCVAALTIAGAFALVASHIRDNGGADGNRNDTP